MTPRPNDDPPAPPRRRRLLRRVVVALMAAPVALVLVAWASQRLWLPAVVRPAVESLTGLESSSRSMWLSPTGLLRASGVTLREPDAKGPAVVTAREVHASLRLGNLITGGPVIAAVTLTEPTFRVAAGLDAGSRTEPIARARRAVRGVLSLPEIEVVDGSVAFIEPGADDAAPVLTITGGGTIRRDPDDPGAYTVELEQTGAGAPIALTGRIDLASHEAVLRARDVELTHWVESCAIARDAAFWRSIVGAGRLVDATVEYDRADGLRTRMEVEGVRLALPTPAGADRRVTLDEVAGVVTLDREGIRAQVAGLIDGLPTLASLGVDGLALTAPFTVDLTGGPFRVDAGWAALALAPPEVRSIIDDFSSPSAQVTARVRLSRDAPADAPDQGIAVSGEVRLRDGAAAFVEFPYPVREIAGVVRFDQSAITLDGLTGVGPTGARVRADGVATPTADGLELDLTIRSPAVPLDGALLAALDPADAELIEAAFSERGLGRLRDAGAVITGAERADAADAVRRAEADLRRAEETGDADRARVLAAALADARRTLERPVFTLGGAAAVTARVRRSPRTRPVIRVLTEVEAASVGLLHDAAPYPLIAEDLRLTIDNARGVRIERGRVRGVTGAAGAITGGIDWAGGATRPDLEISFDPLPVDRVLIESIAAARGAVGERAAPSARLLDRLGAGGVTSLTGRVGADGEGRVIWTARLPIDGVVLAAPDGGPTLDGLDGAVVLSDAGFDLDAAGARLDGTPAPMSLTAHAGAGMMNVHFVSEALPLHARVEPFVSAFDPDLASRIAEARARRRPRGTVAIDATLSADTPDREPDWRVTLTPAGPIEADAPGGRAVVTPIAGRVEITPDRLTFESVSLALADPAGADHGRVTLDGATDGALAISADDLDPASPVLREVVASASPELGRAIEDADAAGRISGELTIKRDAGAWGVVTGEVRPRRLALTRLGRRAEIGEIAGSITLGPSGGEVRALGAHSGAWSMQASGRWFGGDRLGVDLTLSASGRADAGLVALAPASVARLFDALAIDLGDRFSLEESELRINAPQPGADASDPRDGAHFAGVLRVEGASLDAGVTLADAHGEIAVAVDRPPGIATPAAGLSLDIERVRVGGVSVTGLRGRVEPDPDAPGAVRLALDGAAHGGRVLVDGVIEHAVDDASAPDYTVALRLAGLDLVSASDEFVGPPRGAPDGPQSAASADAAMGFVDASLMIAGSAAPGAEAHGQGEIRVMGGELARLPLVMSIFELGSVVPPVNEPLDYASARFTIRGRTARFDRLVVASPSLALVGEGSLTFPDLTLDLGFAVTSSRRLPLWSDLMDVVRNALVTTRVRGTLARPDITGEPLSGPRRFLGRLLLGREPDRVVGVETPE